MQSQKKKNVYDPASELYNELLGTYFDEYYYLSDAERKKWSVNINLKSYFLKHAIVMNDLKMKKQLIKKYQCDI